MEMGKKSHSKTALPDPVKISHFPDPAFDLNADLDPGSQTNADQDRDPDPGQTLKSQKVNFYMKNILKVGIRSKT
jgi:hypothetical protein